MPNTGVTSVGEVARTGAPLPVAVVQTGSADAPPPTSISVVAPAASVWCAPVAVVPAAIRPYAVVLVALPVPPCATVTAALSVRIFADAFGRVNVLKDVVGPVNFRWFVPRTNVRSAPTVGAAETVSVLYSVIFSPPQIAGCANADRLHKRNENAIIDLIILLLCTNRHR